MNEERLMNIILTPHVSEKATVKADSENQHVKDNVKQRVVGLTQQFPLYPNLQHLIQD